MSFRSWPRLSIVCWRAFSWTHREWQQTRVAMLELARFPEQSPTPILRIGADGNVIYSNPAGTTLLRQMAEQAGDPEELLAAWQNDVAQALSEGAPQLREYRVSDRIFECSFVPFRVDGYVNVYTTDVTERRKAEADLRDERDFAMHVMRTMGQGLTITDAGNRYIYVNPAFAQITGREADSLIGLSPTEVIAADDLPVLAQIRAHRLRGEGDRGGGGGAAWLLPEAMASSDYDQHPLLTSTPRWRDGAVNGAITVITDLTERKQVENRDAEAQRRPRGDG